jgi:hypothetical protein
MKMMLERAGINADPDGMSGSEATQRVRPSRLQDPGGRAPSPASAFKICDPQPDIIAIMHFCDHVAVGDRPFLPLGVRTGNRRKRRNKPNGKVGGFCRLNRLEVGQSPDRAKRRNEPNGILGKLCGLLGELDRPGWSSKQIDETNPMVFWANFADCLLRAKSTACIRKSGSIPNASIIPIPSIDLPL